MELPHAAARSGFRLRHLPEAGSTNAEALAAAEAGADRLWIVAERQTSGRGRHGRSWVSPAGNLHASLALIDPAPMALAPLIGFVAGLSLAEAIGDVAPAARAELKWPNDCLINGAKVAGILIEGASLPNGRQALALGIGVNVRQAPAGLDQPVTALADHAPDASVVALFAALSTRIAANLALFARGEGFAEIRARWLDHALAEGTAIRVRLPSGECRGRFAGLGARGELLLATESGTETILAGDVMPADRAVAEAVQGA